MTLHWAPAGARHRQSDRTCLPSQRDVIPPLRNCTQGNSGVTSLLLIKMELICF